MSVRHPALGLQGFHFAQCKALSEAFDDTPAQMAQHQFQPTAGDFAIQILERQLAMEQAVLLHGGKQITEALRIVVERHIRELAEALNVLRGLAPSTQLPKTARSHFITAPRAEGHV